MTLLFWLACADPELAPLVRARDEYTRGAAALDAGRHAEAIEAFAAARAGDPQSPVLALWEARARAASGDVAAAEALATEVLRTHPDAGLAWYNRAAWRLRLGQADAAAGDLRRALKLGVRSPFEAAIDPDFAGVLGTPAFADVLPAGPVLARTQGPDGAVFLGSDVLVQVELVSAQTVQLDLVREGAAPGCLVLDRVVEDRHEEAGVLLRRLDVHLRAVAPCDAVLRFAVEVTAPTASRAESPPVSVKVEAPSTFVAGPPAWLPDRLPLPGALVPTDGDFAAGRVGELVWALGRADRAPTLGGRSPEVGLEYRVDAGTRAAGGAWRHTGAGEVHAGEWRTTVPAMP